MAYTAHQIEKHTIVTRLSVSIYKMPEDQLLQLLEVFEQHIQSTGGDPGETRGLYSSSGDIGIRRQMIIARLFVLIKQIDKDSLLECLRLLDHSDLRWVREFPRLECYLLADFAAEGKAYRGIIRDISAGGVFIETSESFRQGQDIALCYTLAESTSYLPIKIKGRVTRVFPTGIGVQYKNITNYQKDIINSLIHKGG